MYMYSLGISRSPHLSRARVDFPLDKFVETGWKMRVHVHFYFLYRKEVMPMTSIAQYFAQFSWSNKKLIKEGLQRQKGELRIEKELHNVNCPDCGEKPCRKYAWLFMDIQECEHMIQWLNKDLRDTYGE